MGLNVVQLLCWEKHKTTKIPIGLCSGSVTNVPVGLCSGPNVYKSVWGLVSILRQTILRQTNKHLIKRTSKTCLSFPAYYSMEQASSHPQDFRDLRKISSQQLSLPWSSASSFQPSFCQHHDSASAGIILPGYLSFGLFYGSGQEQNHHLQDGDQELQGG